MGQHSSIRLERRKFNEIAVGDIKKLSRTITEKDVDTFGFLSGDLNPLHMDSEFASHTAFGRRVVHGMFSAALVSAVHTKLTGPGFVYVGQDLKFLGPAFIGDTLTVSVTVLDKKLSSRVLVMETLVCNQKGEAVLRGASALKDLDSLSVQKSRS